jgi:metal-responsive CopG/Arc/MetJ family transcriptional regulator
METGKRLRPYSVYLPEDLHIELNKHAQNRKASSMVRDAITMMLQGSKQFDGGYNQALRDVATIIRKHDQANAISWHDITIADDLISEIVELSK